MSWRRRRLLWLAPLGVLAIMLASLYWLLDTRGGARWVLAQVADVRPGLVRTGSLEGTLRGGLVIEDLVIQGQSYRIEAGELRLRAVPGVLPWSLSLGELSASQVAIDIRPDDEAPDVDLRDRLAQLQLPLAIHVRKARIDGVEVSREGSPWFELSTVILAGAWSDRLSDFEGRVEAPGWSAELAGDFAFSSPWDIDLKGVLNWPSAPGGHIEFSVAGDGEDVGLALDTSGPGVQGRIQDWLERPVVTLQAGGEEVLWQDPRSGISVRELQLGIEGQPQAHQWRLDGLLGGPDGLVASLEADGSGDLRAWTIAHLRIGSEPVEASGSGHLAWSPEPGLELQLDVHRVAPGHWLPGWPESFPAQGRVTMAWRGDLRVPEFGLWVPGTSARLDGNGVWETESGTVTADLTWNDLDWPIGADAPAISSAQGTANLTGAVNDWRVSSELTVQARDYPEGRLRLDASGDAQAAQWRLQQGTFAGGQLTGNGAASWDDGFGWQAELELEGVDSGSLWPDWPAVLDGRVHVAQAAGSEVITLRVHDGRALMQGRALTIDGGLDFGTSDLGFRRLRITEPGSAVTLDGGWNDRDLLNFEVAVHRPGRLSELLGTELVGSGRLGVRDGRPLFEGAVTGSGAEWDAWQVERFSLGADSEASLRAVLEGVAQGDRRFPLVEASLRGPWDNQVLDARVTFDASVTPDEAILSARGGWRQWRDPSRLAWTGRLLELDLRGGGESLLRLDEAAELTLGANEVSLSGACLTAPGGGRLCGSGAYRDGEGISLDGDLQDWPLARLLGPFTPGVEFTQRLGGRLNWRHQPGGRPSGHADLVLSAGSFGPRDDAEARISTSTGRFGFAMDDGQLHSGRLELGFADRGRVEIDWGIEDVLLDGSGRLSGRALISTLDLSVLNSLWPDVDRIGGRLDADLALGGRVSDPNFQGRFSLLGARFDYATLGLALTGLDLRGTMEPTDRMVFEGPFRMGDGEGRLTGELDFAELGDPVWNLRVTGEGLRIADLPTLQVDANPDVQLSGRGDQYRLSGDVTIPRAMVSPNGTILSRVDESDDVVITAGELPGAPPEPEAEARPANLGGRLTVRLGNDVRLRMDAVDTRLSGEVVLRWPQDLMPTADGQVFVNGDVRVFGPLLHINRGRVRFNGGPADNPQLNIRASRDVFGNTQVQTAGVLVTGTAKSPDIEAYTDPLTTSERAWGLLITGQDFEYGQGVGAFDIGTYIAPRLYLSYGVSLLDEGNVVSLRYDLKRGFGVKATSSQTENGVDISYTLTRGRPQEDEAGADSP